MVFLLASPVEALAGAEFRLDPRGRVFVTIAGAARDTIALERVGGTEGSELVTENVAVVLVASLDVCADANKSRPMLSVGIIGVTVRAMGS